MEKSLAKNEQNPCSACLLTHLSADSGYPKIRFWVPSICHYTEHEKFFFWHFFICIPTRIHPQLRFFSLSLAKDCSKTFWWKEEDSRGKNIVASSFSAGIRGMDKNALKSANMYAICGTKINIFGKHFQY